MKAIFYTLILLVTTAVFGQDSTKTKWEINTGADIVSRYVWRGADFGNSPSIQPALSLTKGIFEIGYWGAYAVANEYAETDLYAKIRYNNASLMLTDYYIPCFSTEYNDPNYFNLSNFNQTRFDTTTGELLDLSSTHIIEATFEYEGSEKFPISFLAATCIYGNDKLLPDTTFHSSGAMNTLNFKQCYSTYFELGYTFTSGDNELEAFVGITPFAGMYSTPIYEGEEKFGIVNAGLTFSKSVKLTSTFDLPVKTSLICNPQAGNIFMVFGISL